MPNPIANQGQFDAERDVAAQWKLPAVQRARLLVARMFKAGYGDRMPDEVLPIFEESVDEYVTNWLFKAAASDAQYPRFVRNFMPPYKWHGRDVPGSRTGGDNPDNCYRLAGIAHGTQYCVHGRAVGQRPANVSFTLTGNYGTSATIQTIEDHDIQWSADGSFALTIDDRPADGRANHLTTVPNVKFLFVRDSMEDWSSETPLQLEINKVGEPFGIPLSVSDMAERAAFRMCEDVPLYHWFQNVWSSRRENTLQPVESHRGMGGLVTQALAHGHFRLAEDDAIILDYEPAGARYVAIELAHWLYRSIDYSNIQSSLTRTQSSIDGDGRIRAVIARRDPGVANWLDTGGFATVFILHRWQALPPDLVRGGPDVRMTATKIANLKRHLPTDTVWSSTEHRREQLANRHAAYARRIEDSPCAAS
jgi:hypothetical protein